jgi:hypothetical protein
MATAPVDEITVVGQWREPSANDTTEFHADGTLIERPANGEAIAGRYALRGDQLSVRLEGMDEDLTFTVAIGADRLEMRYPDGQVTTYQRVK